MQIVSGQFAWNVKAYFLIKNKNTKTTRIFEFAQRAGEVKWLTKLAVQGF